MIEQSLTIIFAYLIGCLPSAWFVTKYFFGKDIRKEGTGNIGAMNTYDVTGSKISGFLVFFMDFLKGMLTVYLVILIFDSDFYFVRLAGIFAVIGHNYNVFLTMKGGRGLSTSAGVLSLINPISIFLWIIMYFTSKKVINDNVHIGILGGCVGSIILLIGFPEAGLKATATLTTFDILPFKIFHILICVIIISKLIKPLQKLYSSEN